MSTYIICNWWQPKGLTSRFDTYNPPSSDLKIPIQDWKRKAAKIIIEELPNSILAIREGGEFETRIQIIALARIKTYDDDGKRFKIYCNKIHILPKPHYITIDATYGENLIIKSSNRIIDEIKSIWLSLNFS